MHRHGIWINAKVYLFYVDVPQEFHQSSFCFLGVLKASLLFWCAFRWVSPFMTSTTSVFRYLASRISVTKLLSWFFTKDLVFDLDVKHVFRSVKFIWILNLQVEKVGWTSHTIPAFLLSSSTWIQYWKASLYSGWCSIGHYHCQRLKPFVDWCACFYQT